ncbi:MULTISPECIES: hypothetical protein [Rhizobium]|uniref:hypothetical protein n=1 Tax=Rhizobium TaxID=379 RepID=UPI001FF658DF|nr:hypothetical protein [Rhizobium sp. PRIMUS64]MCJ9693052.1 hypothetical protein [Rhizobium sp. PRIMUS64]
MEIAIIFEPEFQGDARSAVWIVESPENRKWFAEQTDLDTGSAIFAPEGGEIGRAAILRSIWNVQEHYPNWSQINVSGVSLTDELSTVLCDEGTLRESNEGFSLARK